MDLQSRKIVSFKIQTVQTAMCKLLRFGHSCNTIQISIRFVLVASSTTSCNIHTKYFEVLAYVNGIQFTFQQIKFIRNWPKQSPIVASQPPIATQRVGCLLNRYSVTPTLQQKRRIHESQVGWVIKRTVIFA